MRKLLLTALLLSAALPLAEAGKLTIRVLDADSGEPLPARIYLQNDEGESFFPESLTTAGSALPYTEQWVPIAGSSELHTTVSPHPSYCILPPGQYTLQVERGKEYIPFVQQLDIGAEDISVQVTLQRWSDMASRGWYSGETHVHRRIHELPNVMAAEDLNVAFPVTFWTVRSDRPPDLSPSPLRRQGPSPFGPREDAGSEPIIIDASHVIFPRNTEYEIFSIGEQRHVLGAMFLLNHQQPFARLAPPVTPIATAAHAEGALIDLDKHSWPWSLMLIPVANVDLFELSNNSVWRTNFGFRTAPAVPPPWTTLERSADGGLTEWGWLNYGFEMYYALLNCGFRLSPSAGTASGVHPVPLGHSRVYVHTGPHFDREQWLQGLKAGRSFVTTGPMLEVTINDQLADHQFRVDGPGPHRFHVQIRSTSLHKPEAIEILVNGTVQHRLQPESPASSHGCWTITAEQTVQIDRTSWIAVRSVVPQQDGRRRFAHTAPWHVTVQSQPVQPRADQVQYFLQLMEAEQQRSAELLPEPAQLEYQQAIQVYRELLERAE